jgi:hypothetical protein
VRGRGAQSLSCASCGSARPLNGDRLLGSLIELPPAAAQAPVMLLIGAAYILVAACATTRPPAVADQCDADPSKGWMQLSAPPPGADRFLNDLPERGKSVAAQLGPIRTFEKEAWFTRDSSSFRLCRYTPDSDPCKSGPETVDFVASDATWSTEGVMQTVCVDAERRTERPHER